MLFFKTYETEERETKLSFCREQRKKKTFLKLLFLNLNLTFQLES